MNFDPIHWLCVALVLVCVTFGVYNRILAADLRSCKATETSVALIGKAQDKEAKKEDNESKENKEEVDEKYRSAIAKLQSDNDKLRKQITRTRSLPPAPQTCTGGGQTTEIDWPDVERTIDDFRIEVRGIVEKGDKEKEGLDTVKEWVDKEIVD